MTQGWKDVIGRLMGVGSLEPEENMTIRLIVGLGNPGSKYDDTRHNVGFITLDALAQRLGCKIRKKKFNALVEETNADGNRVILLKPQQYMNRSGHAVATAAGFYKIPPTNILVVTDDMALDVGRLRLRAKGSAGGHNGLKDIIAHLKSDCFPRLKIGIGESGSMDAADYVLSRFSSAEREIVDAAVTTSVDAMLCWIREGIDVAMTRYNSRNNSDSSE